MRHQYLSKPSLPLILLSLLVLLMANFSTGCGGGSEGTGGITIDGNLKSLDGTPLSDVLVTIEETGDSDITDENGLFRIQIFERGYESYRFRFTRVDFDLDFTIDRPAENARRVELDLELDRASNQINAARIEEISNSQRQDSVDSTDSAQ
jgi:hypothetical protein